MFEPFCLTICQSGIKFVLSVFRSRTCFDAGLELIICLFLNFEGLGPLEDCVEEEPYDSNE